MNSENQATGESESTEDNGQVTSSTGGKASPTAELTNAGPSYDRTVDGASLEGGPKPEVVLNSDVVPSTAAQQVEERINVSELSFSVFQKEDLSWLKPDPGFEKDFEVTDNCFAFSPGQLGKLFNPTSLGAFYVLGGLAGLERGLRTNIKSGLNIDEKELEGSISFEEATQGLLKQTLRKSSTAGTGFSRIPTASSYHNDPGSFVDRKRVFGDGQIPHWKGKNIFQYLKAEYVDAVLILLTLAALTTIALGLYQTIGQNQENESFSWREGIALCVAIFIVVFLGAVNDWRKEQHFIKLGIKQENRDRPVKVTRSGKAMMVSSLDLLVGDVALLGPGDAIPADGILIKGHNIECDESSVTGNSGLVGKTPTDDVFQALSAGADPKKMDPFIYSGATIQQGRGSYLVTATGVRSVYGRTMMSLIQYNDGYTDTRLQKMLNALTNRFAKIGLTVSVLLFMVLFIRFLVQLKHGSASGTTKGLNFLSLLVISVTLIDVAVPSGLPLAMTVTLAFATSRMLKNKILVRNMGVCETLEHTTTICTETTGLLTENAKLVVAGIIGNGPGFGDSTVMSKLADRSQSQKVAGGETGIADKEPKEVLQEIGRESLADNPTIAQYITFIHPEVKELLRTAIVSTSAAVEVERDGVQKFIGPETDAAFLTFSRQHLDMNNLDLETLYAPRIIQSATFDQITAVITHIPGGTYRMHVKGRSETLLEKCDEMIVDSRLETSTSISKDALNLARQKMESLTSNSLQTIGFVYRDFETWPPPEVRNAKQARTEHNVISFHQVFEHMTFLGILGIQDPLRVDALDTVRACQKAGVFVRLVTSDSVLTANAVAEQTGIQVPGSINMVGPHFRRLTRRQRHSVIPKLTLLAEATADDKSILINDLESLGETVALTDHGHNISNVSALKTASVSFTTGTASSDLAKAASGIILLDDSFKSVLNAVLWGRTVGDSVRKFLQFQLTINITAIALTFVSSVINPSRQSVLNSVQLLWVNLIMDLFAILALATDPPSEFQLTRKPPPRSGLALITLKMGKMILGQTIYQLAMTLTLYHTDLGILGFDDAKTSRDRDSLVFNTYVWMQIFNLINCRRIDNRLNVFEGIHKNRVFLLVTLTIIGVQFLLIFFGGKAINTVNLTSAQWGCSILIGALTLPTGVVIRFIPDHWIRRCIPEWLNRRRRKRRPFVVAEEGMITDIEPWDQGLLDIKDELKLIKKLRGGRIRDLRFKSAYHRRNLMDGLVRRRSRSRSGSIYDITFGVDDRGSRASSANSVLRHRRHGSRSSSIGSAMSAPGVLAGSVSLASPGVMAGIVGGSIAGWSPVERSPSNAEDRKPEDKKDE